MQNDFNFEPAPPHLPALHPPFIWPDARVLTSLGAYPHTPPFRDLVASADLVSAVLVGLDDPAIQWIQELSSRREPVVICVVIVLTPAGPTREEHLRAMTLLQASIHHPDTKLEVRLFPMDLQFRGDSEVSVLPPTAIHAYNSESDEAVMCIGSAGDAGHDAVNPGSLNFVFSADNAMRDEWRRWFQFLFESAKPLSAENVGIPHLIPASGSPEAAEQWARYKQLCSSPETDSAPRMPQVDPATGEVVSTTEGTQVTPWDAGAMELDPLAQVFHAAYAEGWLVTVEEATRIKPLSIPVKATLLGERSERTIGALTQKQSFTLRVFDEETDKAMEKFRKVTDLINLLTLPLSIGNRWLPKAARPLLEKEVEKRNADGRAALIKALGGKDAKDIAAFIERKKASLRENLNEMYRELGRGDVVPEEKFAAVLADVEARLKGALGGRITPQLVFNRLQAPNLAGKAPDANWSQPLNLLAHSAETLRKSLTDPYFIRQFSGLSFGEKDYREVCNPFGDHVFSSPGQGQPKDELRVMEQILDSSMNQKSKCQAVWHLIHGTPHFYFETCFRAESPPSEWPKEFVIITAFATTGRQWTDAENATADRELMDDISATNRMISRVIGYSPESGHEEPGWAADLSERDAYEPGLKYWQDACELGLKYRQDAIYVVREDQLFVTFCDTRRQLVPVAAFSARVNPAVK